MSMLRNHDVQFEPIESDLDWPGTMRKGQVSSQFKADWTSTLQLLDAELTMVSAQNVVLQTFHTRRQVRADGAPRGDVSPRRPGVVLRFERKQRPLKFPCDKFASWQENLRAIALGLESLRRVERYGIVQSDEQYRGWQALPAPMSPGDELRTAADAKAFLRRVIGGRVDALTTAEAIREAAKATHPDQGGNSDDFKRVMKCERLLQPA